MKFILAYKMPKDIPSGDGDGVDWGTLVSIDTNDPNYPGWEGGTTFITPSVDTAPTEIWIDDMKFIREASLNGLYPYRYSYSSTQSEPSILHPDVYSGMLEPMSVCVGGDPVPEYENATIIAGTERYANRWVLTFYDVDYNGPGYILNDPDEVLEQVGGASKKWQWWTGSYTFPGLIAETGKYLLETYDIMYEEEGNWYPDTYANGEDGTAIHACNGESSKNVSIRLTKSA